jgi:hypothetical protein
VRINLTLDKDFDVAFDIFCRDLDCLTAAKDLQHVHVWMGNGEYSGTIRLLDFLQEELDIPLVAFICFVKPIDEKESIFELSVEAHKELYKFANLRFCLVYLAHEV